MSRKDLMLASSLVDFFIYIYFRFLIETHGLFFQKKPQLHLEAAV